MVRTARDALSCEGGDASAGPGGIAAKASAGRELLRTDEVAFCGGCSGQVTWTKG